MKYKFTIDPRIKFGIPELILPNIIQIKGDITENLALEVIDNIITAQNSNQEIIPLLIDTYGGDAYAMFSIIDMLKTCTVPVATILCGKSMSAGSVLFSCGTEGHRYMSENSTIMIHHTYEEGGSGGSKIHDSRANTNELERINEKMLEILSTNCGKSKDYFKKLLTKNNHADLYLNAQQCIKHNLANHIRIPDFDVKVEMKVSFG